MRTCNAAMARVLPHLEVVRHFSPRHTTVGTLRGYQQLLPPRHARKTAAACTTYPYLLASFAAQTIPTAVSGYTVLGLTTGIYGRGYYDTAQWPPPQKKSRPSPSQSLGKGVDTSLETAAHHRQSPQVLRENTQLESCPIFVSFCCFHHQQLRERQREA